MAAASAEYLALESSTDRAKFAQERYGKQWTQFAKLLEKGPEQVRAMAAAVDEGHLFDDEDLARVEAYRASTDQLHDTWEAFTMSLGESGLPILNNLLTEINSNIEESGTAVGILRFGFDDLFRSVFNLTEAEEDAATATDDHTASMEDAGASAESLSKKYSEQMSMIQKLGGVSREELKSIAWNHYLAQLSAEGFTQAELEQANEVGEALGIVQDGSLEMAEAIDVATRSLLQGQTGAQGFAAALNSIPTDVYVNVHQTTITGAQGSLLAGGATQTDGDQAIGGPDKAGGAYRVHQDEIFVPSTNGYTLTRTDARNILAGAVGGGGGGKTIHIENLYITARGTVREELEELG
jgi:hypothetical protein